MMRVNLRAGWRTALIGLVLMMASTHARAQGSICDDWVDSDDWDIYAACTGYEAYEGEVEISVYVWSNLNGSYASGYDTFWQVLVANPGTEFPWDWGFTSNECILGLGCSQNDGSYSFLWRPLRPPLQRFRAAAEAVRSRRTAAELRHQRAPSPT